MTRGRTVPPPRQTEDADIRPTVARTRGPNSNWLIVGAAVLGAILLFGLLDHRRRELTAPSTSPRSVDQVRTVAALPPLTLPFVPPPPPLPMETDPGDAGDLAAALAASPPSANPPPAPAPSAGYVPRPPAPPSPPPTYSPPQGIPPASSRDPLPRTSQTGAVLVIDTAAVPEAARGGPDETPGATPQVPSARAVVRSGSLRRPAVTVPEGTLIPAVLETAMDSTQPGFVRAIVSHDVSGFDGSRILIPRGSRLFGEYQADLGAGQNRAMVLWTRLVRPDGVTIALASPTADLRGRAGVAGRVDNRYLERFGAALLQTTLNVGASLAGRSLGDGAVIVALPGSTQTAAPSPSSSQIQPSLRVEAGTQVTVFVSRDLEFSSGVHRP